MINYCITFTHDNVMASRKKYYIIPIMLTKSDKQDTETQIFSVSEITQCAKDLLEECFSGIWIEAEISNFACPGSGHWYFSLKDSKALIRCAMFRMHNRQTGFTPEDGSKVLVRGKISLYQPRGDFQMIIEHMEHAGEGALQRQFEILKKKLTSEGLFDKQHKKPLPETIRALGVITSATGAAIRDILSVLKRRYPLLPVIIYPCLVQGKTAADTIISAIQTACRRDECDILLLTRGGGSLEDLWPFNEEKVAREIFACPLPIVSAVGHEVDFTISDFVADVRAPTPSAGAELISPDQLEIQAALLQQQARLTSAIKGILKHLNQIVMALQKQLQHPGRRLNEQAQRLDYCILRLSNILHRVLNAKQQTLQKLQVRLDAASPAMQLQKAKAKQETLSQRLCHLMTTQLTTHKYQLATLAKTLHSVSPLATIDRGYAILQNKDQVIRTVKQVQLGESLQARLSDGELSLEVKDIREKA